jgi:pimeloyl-ACP methyl ester carboxylesterase
MERLTRAGISLCFEEGGSGAPPILLIHDLGCDHTGLQPQLQYFRRRHRVVAPDLLGHGQSDRLSQACTVAGYAEDLAWLCYELGLYRPVALGHGLGGLMALELTATCPDLLAAVVVLDAPLVPRPEIRGRIDDARVRFHRVPDREAVRQWLRLRAPLADNSPKEDLVEALANSPPLASTWENVLACDGSEALARCRVPILFVQAETEWADVGRLRELSPGIVVESVRCKRLDLAEAANQVNALISGFLT